MGIVKEPEGVDFVIKSRPLTKKEEARLSQFIADQKNKRTKGKPLVKTYSIRRKNRATTKSS